MHYVLSICFYFFYVDLVVLKLELHLVRSVVIFMLSRDICGTVLVNSDLHTHFLNG